MQSGTSLTYWDLSWMTPTCMLTTFKRQQVNSFKMSKTECPGWFWLAKMILMKSNCSAFVSDQPVRTSRTATSVPASLGTDGAIHFVNLNRNVVATGNVPSQKPLLSCVLQTLQVFGCVVDCVCIGIFTVCTRVFEELTTFFLRSYCHRDHFCAINIF